MAFAQPREGKLRRHIDGDDDNDDDDDDDDGE